MKITNIEKEKKVLTFMVNFYCRRRHGSHQLCSDCRELLIYAVMRLDCCPFGEQKTSCRKCSVHCYKSEMRKRVKKVMRYSGPLMFLLSPIEAFRHIFK